jgi:CDP-glucose 4,6-dehydratase
VELLDKLNLGNLSGPVLITGHNGFKGMWLSLLLSKLGFEVYGLSLPPDGRALSQEISKNVVKREELFDINNYAKLTRYMDSVQPHFVIHLAAQPLVKYSYNQPMETVLTNVMGTASVLEASNQVKSVKCVAVTTTDKVYENFGSGIKFTEASRLRGSDPYSASKVATESIVDAWRCMSRVREDSPKLVTLRAGNVIGGGDLATDRLIPDLIRGFQSSSVVPVRNPESTRPWQFVLDPLFGYLKAISKSIAGESSDSYNFGPIESNTTVAQLIVEFNKNFDNKIQTQFISRIGDLHEADKLELDSSKAISELGWNPIWSQQEAVYRTSTWWSKFLNHELDSFQLCCNDTEDYLNTLLGKSASS